MMNWEFRSKQGSGAQTEKRLRSKLRRATRSARSRSAVDRRLGAASVGRTVLGMTVGLGLGVAAGLGLCGTLLGNPSAESYAFERASDDFRLRAVHPAMQQGDTSPYTKPEPAYAKWGKLAVAETKARYPNAQVVDYLHVGRQNLDDDLAKETFKLWLRSPAREFGVIVTITFEKPTEKVRSIEFCETTR